MGEALPLFLGEDSFVCRAEIRFPAGEAGGYEVAIELEIIAVEERLFAAADPEEDRVDGRDGNEVGAAQVMQYSKFGDRFCEEGEEGFGWLAGEFAGGLFLHYKVRFAGGRR